MNRLPRRTVLASTAALIAGCTASETQPTDSETPHESPTLSPEPTSPTTAPNTETATQTPETDTPTSEPPLAVPEPDLTIQYGETSVDAGFAITVELPTIDTSFTYEGEADETFEMPDGQALALAHVTLENTHEEEFRHISAPNFILVSDELAIVERYYIKHPAFKQRISRTDLKRVEKEFRWRGINGVGFNTGSMLQTHALFVLPEELDPKDCEILYDPTLGITYNYYSEDIVAWTATGQ